MDSHTPKEIARLTREFLRQARQKDPEGYAKTLKKYPVNEHIVRDEKVHEVPLSDRITRHNLGARRSPRTGHLEPLVDEWGVAG